MSTFNVDANVRRLFDKNQILHVRYLAAFDARAGDLKYHKTCIKSGLYNDFLEQEEMTVDLACLVYFIPQLEKSLSQGSVFYFSDAVLNYDKMIKENDLNDLRSYRTKLKWLKQKIVEFISNFDLCHLSST